MTTDEQARRIVAALDYIDQRLAQALDELEAVERLTFTHPSADALRHHIAEARSHVAAMEAAARPEEPA